MSDHQAGTGPNPSPHNVNVASGQTVRIQQVLAATPQNVNVLTSRGQQLYIASQVNVPGLTQVIPTIPSNNAGIQQGVARILNITPSSRVNVVGVPQVPGRTASVQLTNTGNNASGEVSGRGAMSLVAISQPSAINAASHPTLVSTLSSPPRQRTTNSIGIMQSSPTLVLTPSHNVRSPANPHSSPQSSTSGIPRKRIRLIEMQENPPPSEEIAMARKNILDHKTVQMSAVREQFAERTAELFFLQLGGNMMDYFSWRKRAPSAQFLHFLRTNPLDPDDDDEDLTQVLSKTLSAPSTSSSEAKSVVTSTVVPPVTASASQQPPSQLPQAAPVQKVPDQPSIPVTVATSSSSSVPCTSPVKQSKAPSIVRQHPKTPSISSVYETSIGNQEQIAEKAKQEAYVMQRIVELQKEGLWSEKRLPKVQEPPRAKAHWDYLVEEMVWLAADFAQERKWKKAAAKKCARGIQKYFQEKAIQAQKAEKTQELRLRKIANFIAKEIKTFWSNVEKLVEFKQQTRLEEKRKKALDQHLSFIVDQTERYSTWLAESMNKSGVDNANPSVPPSVNSSVLSSPARQDGVSDDEFQPNQSSTDDEETIAREEEEEDVVNQSNSEEIEMLKRESELPLEDLLKELPEDYLERREESLSKDKSDDEKSSTNDDEFIVESGSSDDEETIQEQEKVEGSVDHKEELAALEAEGEMSLEDLLAKYGGPECLEAEMDDQDQETDKSDSESECEGDDAEASDEEEEDKSSDENEDVGLKSLLDDASTSVIVEHSKNDATGKEISDVAALAESIQPKGSTLSSTNVVTTIPFLLKHTLREYQHIGLDWLVTMFDRKLNGILADEMGLGKTIQTISLLAHLACEKGNWGPHLIIVPTSVMLNWEMEFKKWCPAFKILTYYGTQKERKQKRTGWTKPNAFHVCITSYKLVIQDHQSFRRKKWKYLILDEAQNIKNFKSQRWQLLLNFQTQRRLLLTGTPLQNNLMELWSLMHFLMPNVFQSHREFKEWFSNPVTGMIEGNSEYNDSIIKRLHKVLRPFLLRRLKIEVEKQLPKKYEHIVMCRLSKRQRFLYDDFMSRAKTKETLATGNLLSVINVLMQLRKVCNHPNLFEVRPTVSPFQMEGIVYVTATLIYTALNYDPCKHVNLDFLNLHVVDLESCITAFVAHCIKKLCLPRHQIEQVDKMPDPPPPCPRGKVKMNIRYTPNPSPSSSFLGSKGLSWNIGGSRATASSLLKTVLPQGVGAGVTLRVTGGSQSQGYSVQLVQQGGQLKAIPVATLGPNQQVASTSNAQHPTSGVVTSKTEGMTRLAGYAQIVQTSTGRHILLASPQMLQTSGSQSLPTTTTVLTASGQRLTVLPKALGNVTTTSVTASNRLISTSSLNRPIGRVPPLNINASAAFSSSHFLNNVVTSTTTITTTVTSSTTKTSAALSQPMLTTLVQHKTRNTTSQSPSMNPTNTVIKADPDADNVVIKTEPDVEVPQKKKLQDAERQSVFFLPQLEEIRQKKRKEKLSMMASRNHRRCEACPMYGADLRESLATLMDTAPCYMDRRWKSGGYVHCLNTHRAIETCEEYFTRTVALSEALHSAEQYVDELEEVFSRFLLCVPAVSAPQPKIHVSHPPPSQLWALKRTQAMLQQELSSKCALLHPIASAMVTQFPDPRLIQYDCGKLQVLDRLLRRLKSDHHRVLIFTQMTRMLDVLEAFLNFHGHIYLRLDGTTRVDQRQVLMERFNADKRIFCFILSTRSGGIGVNLTGADTVIFYDSDWNPTMDAQAQDRCHRIGQTRDVHIYRLVSEMTVEENILKKANQKRLLGDLAIEGGNFTTAYFKSSTIQDLFNIDVGENDASRRMAEVLERDIERRRQSDSQLPPSPHEDKVALGALESALAAAEDETDVLAARTAKAEAAADLAEFDENIPLEEGDANGDPEMSRAEQEVNNIMQQLTPVERYAMKFVEETDSAWSAEQLAAAEAEIEQQKREWELGRLQALKEEEERRLRMEDDDDQLLTFSREDSQNQIWISDNCKEQMPMWCPPTPPQDDNDVYIDHSIGFLYEQTVMSESQLPAIYIKKEQKRLRLDNSSIGDRESRRPLKMRHREESMFAPRSLFDRPTPAIMKMRRDIKLQKYRGIMRNQLPIPGLKPPVPSKPLSDQDSSPEWLIHEDWALLQAVQEYLDLPLNLTVLSPAHTPNWDFVSEIVNNVSRAFRSAKQCRNRYETVIIPREEGRLLYDVSPKKPKKNKTVGKPPQQTKANRPMRTSQLYLQDNHGMYTRLYSHRFETIKSIANKKQSTTKPAIANPLRNPKHATVLAENGVNYEAPLTPLEVAIKRAERIAKEKQKVVQAQLLSEQRRLQQLQQQQTKQQMQQQLQQQQAQQQQAAAQAKAGITSSQQVPLGSVVTSAASSSSPQAVVVGINPNQELLAANQVRAVTSSSGSLVTVASLNSAQVQVAAQRLATVSLPSQTQTVSVSTPTKAGTVTGTKPMSVQILRHMRQPGQHPQLQQQQLQQQQHHRLAPHQQLKVLQAAQAAGQAVAPGQKVSVAMTSGTVGGVAAVQVSQATAQRVQQFMNMKQAAAAAASAGGVKQTVSRTVTDSEMAAIIKRQQQQQQLVAAQQKNQLQVASQPTLSQAQAHLLAQAGIQMQAGTSGQTQVATLVKAVSTPGGTTQSVTIPVTGMTLPQMKATFSPGTKGASPQQIRQLALHSQLLQQRKLPVQKVAQLTQVTGKGGVPAQLIVQSPKAMPTTVTVQQIQQVIKQVPSQSVQHITHVSGGQAVVSQPSGSQMISHAVLTKGSQVPGAAQTLHTRVIPMSANQQGLKQTIQVVTAGPGGRTSVPNVTIDSAGRPTVTVASTLASALAGTIKVTPSSAQQQAILSQVSAALQGQHVQQIRQSGSSPMRIQAVAVQQQGQALPAVIAQPNPPQAPSSQENPQ